MDVQEKLKTAIMDALAGHVDVGAYQAFEDALIRELEKIGSYQDDGVFAVYPDDETEGEDEAECA